MTPEEKPSAWDLLQKLLLVETQQAALRSDLIQVFFLVEGGKAVATVQQGIVFENFIERELAPTRARGRDQEYIDLLFEFVHAANRSKGISQSVAQKLLRGEPLSVPG